MEVLYQRCCGLDVHKETVVVRTFSTMTAGLMALSEWLAENKWRRFERLERFPQAYS
jgi:transposase